ncbi:hypothetical protein EH206_20785 [Brenneria nigrifluens DSM 30175 = ATCC 13028]|uniref:Uncharacterized protein n=1 Tax=Brenneria nigrifluens DSM 30175 = ATCC 13028 TaxID=1121120 RepID=A0A2U1UP38_9GAMM|nr:hypothetical protein DDT54_15075 [Brenneria nigrifluens DSM 30175 = ATCC 13028]QCR06369.1 hypothetical protein EH206_20785 [Brenneria nigrifluens DSM 30175 = ATCC 13028]
MSTSAVYRVCRKCRARSICASSIWRKRAAVFPAPATKKVDLCRRLLYNPATPRYNKVFFPKTL